MRIQHYHRASRSMLVGIGPVSLELKLLSHPLLQGAEVLELTKSAKQVSPQVARQNSQELPSPIFEFHFIAAGVEILGIERLPIADAPPHLCIIRGLPPAAGTCSSVGASRIRCANLFPA